MVMIIKNNWVCVFQNGDIELLSGPRPSMDGLLFRLSSFAAGNHYVDPTVDDNFAWRVLCAIKTGWEQCEKEKPPYPFTVGVK
ncbi:hypothetical protein [Ligilactobacillus sp. 110_WCHN]|nr:hypothetical protein [Ligilactobacillus sp. 110_WCHN]MDO3392808.1 hypothetical protein [Ligilactobacillus sp. 110_WCHN]